MGCPQHPNAGTTSRLWTEGRGANRRTKTTNKCDACGTTYESSDNPTPEPEEQTSN